MNSIKKKLSRYISISISTLLILILLATDISVDTWISNEFDRAMINKVGLLETLVEEEEDEVEFDFAGEFMPEFEGRDNPEYYQLWYENSIFERSDTLELFDVQDLPRLEVGLNENRLVDITLPDGRKGRLLFTKFLPQIDSELRDKLGITREQFALRQKPMELAYALSREELNHVLWLVDIIFITASLVTVVAIRKIVALVVDKSLKPIKDFSDEIKSVSLNSAKEEVTVEKLPEELIPIANGVNQFIRENRVLYRREQRVTSDIAHELKTPIAELLNLSEVAVKFPHEKEISETLAHDVSLISTRLKNIVNGILLLQKSSGKHALDTSKLDLIELISEIIDRENTDNREFIYRNSEDCRFLKTNRIALDTVISNLVNNAIFYSPQDTPIKIDVTKETNSKISIRVINSTKDALDADELKQFFEPLWQKDQSRTSSERYGLGLAIVKSYCDRLGAAVSVSIQNQQICFTLEI